MIAFLAALGLLAVAPVYKPGDVVITSYVCTDSAPLRAAMAAAKSKGENDKMQDRMARGSEVFARSLMEPGPGGIPLCTILSTPLPFTLDAVIETLPLEEGTEAQVWQGHFQGLEQQPLFAVYLGEAGSARNDT